MNNGKIDSTSPIYTLRVVAELSGIADHSIRQYIEKGLIIPFKTDSNRNRFSQVDVARLFCIRKYFDLGLNVAGIKAQYSLVPCWKIKGCSKADQEVCDGFTSPIKPCWESISKGEKCRNADCRTCPVYMLPEHCGNLKAFLKEFDKQ